MVSNNCDCVVVGGGMIGLSCAARLARERMNVVLLDRGRCGRGASWAAAGILSIPDPRRKDTGAILQRNSVEMFPDFCADLLSTTGIDPQYRRCGLLEIFHEDQQWRMARSKVFPRSGRGDPNVTGPWWLLSPAELFEFQPEVTRAALGGLWCETAAQVRTPRLLQALRRYCELARVEIRESVEATGFEPAPGGRIRIGLANGETIEARYAIACSGARTGKLNVRCPPHSHSATSLHESRGEEMAATAAEWRAVVDVRPVRGQILLLDGRILGLKRMVQDRFCYLVPREDGLLLLGATVEPEVGFDESVTESGRCELMAAGTRLIPSLAELPVIHQWAGLRPECPDAMPKIGPHQQCRGLIIAAGHYRNGISLAPLTAEVVADYILRGATDRLGRWNPSRVIPRGSGS